MFRAIRRWWARITHRHEYVVIWRGRVCGVFTLAGVDTDRKYKRDCILERCTCGHERAREWIGLRWRELDIDFVNDQLARQEIDIPARHQE